VFDRDFALDTETTLINDSRPWATPNLVLAAACDDRQGLFVQRGHLREFFNAHQGVVIALHNAAFDLAVIHQVIPAFDIYRLVERGLIYDTQLLHRLYQLGSAGHTASGKGESTLDTCLKQYLNIELPKSLRDSVGDDVRLSYGKWLGQDPREIEPIYLEYLGKDALATFLLFRELQQRVQSMLQASHDAAGYVDAVWLSRCVEWYGPQTHHIQLQASIVLREITANGLSVDLERRDNLQQALDQTLAEHRAALRDHGYMPGQKGCNKALQEILRRIVGRYPDVEIPRTEEKGEYQTGHEALLPLAGLDPFVDTLLGFRTAEKLKSSFADKLSHSRLHPSFNVLLRTGRTSSFGALNSQNLPRDPRVRDCFTPSPGHVFVSADYATIEMTTLAQTVLGRLKMNSKMAECINAGRDLHRLIAAAVFQKPEDQVSKTERDKAKPINFGKPGGMGNHTLKRYAEVSYRVNLSDAEVERFSTTWLEYFPEMAAYLADDFDLPGAIAAGLGLTPQSFHEQTSSFKFLDHREQQGIASQPSAILGGMLLKSIKSPAPQTNAGRPYDEEELDYFWSRLAGQAAAFPPKFRQAILKREPSPGLQRAVMRQYDRGAVYTLTGRLRAGASYTERHNTPFQGLAADGAKIAIWRLWRAGFRIVNFVHDEMLVEIPEGVNYALYGEIVRKIMIDAMREVTPDVRVEVEYVVTRKWSKHAKSTLDADGRIVSYAENTAT
jgi:hypothetical protein